MTKLSPLNLLVFDEIKDDLNTFGLVVKDEHALNKFIELSGRYNVPRLSLVEKYVAFRSNHNLSDTITKYDISNFEKENFNPTAISKTVRAPCSKTLKPTSILPETMRKEMLLLITFNNLFRLKSQENDTQSDLVSSYLTGMSVNMTPLASSKNTTQSTKKITFPQIFCKILCSYSSFLDISVTQSSETSIIVPSEKPDFDLNIEETKHNNIKPTSSRYMYQGALSKAEILDNWAWNLIKRILHEIPEKTDATNSSQSVNLSSCFSEALDTSKHSKTDDTEAQPPTSSVINGSTLRPVYVRLQSPSLVAGRVAVCPVSNGTGDAQTMGGQQPRLHASNACLIGSRRAGGGEFTRAMLDLSSSSAYALYPGQPIVLRATNPTGRALNTSIVFQAPISPLPAIDNNHPASEVHIAVACGPFTTNNSHEVTPLLSLLHDVKQKRPHVLILMGPIVDSAHPLIDEYFDSTYEELYQSRLNTIAEWCFLLKIRLVVVSSSRETHGNPVYPTPPLSTAWTQTPELIPWYKNVSFVWDPCMLAIGPFSIGVSSPDVLFQLSSEEISLGCTGDRLARLCHHVLASCSFYPVHPPADNLPLDYPLWQAHAQFPSNLSPHCLILPSRLRAFIKNIDGVICVNPGFVGRAESSGSYAHIVLSTNTQDKSGAMEETENDELCSPQPIQVNVVGEVTQL